MFRVGNRADVPYPTTQMHQRNEPRKLIELLMVSNFVEVFLAKQGHLNEVGVNFLEKVQLPHLASIYGAMLAGVGYVLMGAGIPLHIPGVIDNFAAGKPAEYKLAVIGAAPGQDTQMRFDPSDYVGRAASDFVSSAISGYCFIEHSGDHHAASRKRPSGRTCDRDPDCWWA